MTAPYLIAAYACVAMALHELVFRQAVDDNGLTPLGAKVFALAWPVWALCIALVYGVTLVFEVIHWWRKP